MHDHEDDTVRWAADVRIDYDAYKAEAARLRAVAKRDFERRLARLLTERIGRWMGRGFAASQASSESEGVVGGDLTARA